MASLPAHWRGGTAMSSSPVRGPIPACSRRRWRRGLISAALDGLPLPPQARATLLFGRPAGPVVDAGPIVCACLKVGARVIDAAIAAGGATPDALGEATGAGTNCGSCRPELARMITAARGLAHAV